MARIEWDEQYEVGHDLLNQQHQRMVAIINRLGDAIDGGKERPALMSILSDLTGYTKKHFAEEERIMAQAGYPALDEHHAQHEVLNNTLADFYRTFFTTSRPLADEVMVFLQHWLYDHILDQDKLYAPFLVGTPANGHNPGVSV